MRKKAVTFGAVALLVVATAVAAFLLRPRRQPVSLEPIETATFEPRLSRIATPVTVPLEDLQRLADQRLSGQIYSENREVAAGITVDIVVLRRDSPIEMHMADGWLTTGVPIRVQGTPNVRLGPFRLPGSTAGGFEADLDVRMRTRVRMNPDWTVSPETEAEIDVGRADLTVAGRVMDATPVVSEILDRNVHRITGPLEDYLANLDVRTMMEPVWEQFREPVRLSEEPRVWLRILPQRFSISPPDTEAENVRFDIGMEAYLDSVVGERPAPVDPGPIPDLDEASADFGSFSVAIPIAFEMAELNQILSEQLTGREDRIGENAVVRWKAVTLGGAGNRLNASVEFEAETGLPVINRLAGTMTLEGRPTYDPASRTLTMENVDYELQADSAFATLADWLLHERLREQIQSELVFPMGEIIDSLHQRLRTRMESISIGDYGTAEAGIERIQPTLQGISDNTIDLAVVADGTLGLDLSLAPVLSGRE